MGYLYLLEPGLIPPLHSLGSLPAGGGVFVLLFQQFQQKWQLCSSLEQQSSPLFTWYDGMFMRFR